MHKTYLAAISILMIITIESCSKKTLPGATPAAVQTTTARDTLLTVKKNDSVVTIKPVIKRKPKESIPKVISVNDKFASKSVDGRLYYDLQGHRYWRNNKDGKYYLFNKSMLSDEAFKKQK